MVFPFGPHKTLKFSIFKIKSAKVCKFWTAFVKGFVFISSLVPSLSGCQFPQRRFCHGGKTEEDKGYVSFR
uniref:Uncharacterized protein n=1 Tax=Bursaphelenchus xylophilus TaxID=6326 RepID=A0A1I7RTP9_BURXY